MIGIENQTKKYRLQAQTLNEFVAESKNYRNASYRKRYANALDKLANSVLQSTTPWRTFSESILLFRKLTTKATGKN